VHRPYHMRGNKLNPGRAIEPQLLATVPRGRLHAGGYGRGSGLQGLPLQGP